MDGVLMTTRLKMALLAIVLVGLLIPAQGQAILYYGSLAYPTGLHAQGRWAGGPAMIEWWVGDSGADGWWNYKYRLSHAAGGTSHMIFETSTNFTVADIANAYVNDAGGNMVPYTVVSDDIKTHLEMQGNPDMPGNLYGVKFDRGITGLATTIQFDSRRMPMWGDFYSKDGGNNPVDAAWNLGFLATDPIDPPGNGSIANHILVPDTVVQPIPEPASLLLLGTGLVGFAAARRRRKSS